MTAANKLVTSQLKEGDRIVVRDAGSFLTHAANKTGDDKRVATVTGLRANLVNRPGRRAQRVYTILTDIGEVSGNAPAQTYYNFGSVSERSQNALLSQTVKPEAVENSADDEEPANLTVINATDGYMHVHKIGCRDIPRVRANGRFDIYAVNEDDAVREIWSDFIEEWDGDLGQGEDNTHFYPCISWPTFKMTINVPVLNAKLDEINRPDLKLPEPTVVSDKAHRNFTELAENASSEAARNYWQMRANERVFLS